MVRRIRRPEDKEELLEALTNRGEGGVFLSYKDALVFAAALGYRYNKSVPFEKSSEAIDWSIFKDLRQNAFINMLALNEEKDLAILGGAEFDTRMKIFEYYANGGLEIIQEKVSNSTRPLIYLLMDLVDETKDDKIKDIDIRKILT